MDIPHDPVDSPNPTSRSRAFPVGIVGAVIGIGLFFSFLSYYGDITGFLWASNRDAAMVAHLESQVGRPVVLIDGTGHDGQYFFLQAIDPWLLHPDEGLQFLDFPTYRAQRMLYPVIAGLGGLLQPPQILWGLVMTNLLAMAAGSWGLGRVAAGMGMSPWLGLAFVLNPGLIFEMAIDGGALLGLALAVWALVAIQDHRWVIAAALLTGAILARETLILVAVGAFAYVWWKERRRRLSLVVAPGLAAAIWWLVVRKQLENLPSPTSTKTLDIPLRGLWMGLSNWISTGSLNLALGILVVLCAVIIVASAVLRPSLLSWATVGFVPLLLILNPAITVGGLNITRAMAPVVSAALVLVLGRQAFRERARSTVA
jgi:hypothetical protein